MTRQIVVQDATYDKLKILNKKIGRNYSMNTLIDGLIKHWVLESGDEEYLKHRQKEICNKFLIDAKNEELIKAVTPELQTVIYLIISGKLYAAQSYLTNFFGGIIKEQRKQRPSEYAIKKEVKK